MKNKASGKSEKLKHAFDLVKSSILPIQDVAREVGVDKTAFSVLFKRKYRVLPSELRKQGWREKGVKHDYNKMRLALKDVKKPYKPVAKIASDYGFKSVKDFEKQFRNLTGVLPAQYRAENWDDIMAGLSDYVHKAMKMLDEEPLLKHSYIARAAGFNQLEDNEKNNQVFSTYFKREVGISLGAYTRMKNPEFGAAHLSRVRKADFLKKEEGKSQDNQEHLHHEMEQRVEKVVKHLERYPKRDTAYLWLISGFDSEDKLLRTFKKIKGCSIAQYRRNLSADNHSFRNGFSDFNHI